jgi:hypothetical protein
VRLDVESHVAVDPSRSGDYPSCPSLPALVGQRLPSANGTL